MIVDSFNYEDTFMVGAMCATEAKKGDIFCLYGEVGAGKTAFTKGFAAALKIEEEVVSPTFNIVQAYEGIKKLYHFDVYRIEDIKEMENIGFDDYLFGDGICVIEWAEMVEELLPKERINVKIIKVDNDENARIIEIGE